MYRSGREGRRRILDDLAYAAQVAQPLPVSLEKDQAMYWNHNRTDEGWAREFAAIQEITRTGDRREGIRAFLEKREANYMGPYYDNSPWGRGDK